MEDNFGFSVERGFIARRGDFEASFAIDKDHVRVEVRRLGEVFLDKETWIDVPRAADTDGFLFALGSLAICSQLARVPDALLALDEAAGGYRRPNDEDMWLMSDETLMSHMFADGFARGVTVALRRSMPELPGEEGE